MSPQIHIKFDGLDAANHVVDMRLLGKSLQGYDRIISDGIILFTQKRLPRRGERAPILIKAQAPKEGSQDIFAILQENASVLPFGWQILTDGTSNFIWHWVSFVLERIGGRKADSERHLEAMLEIIKTHSAERAQSEERWLAHDAAWRDQLFELVNRLIPAAGQAVAPVGTSASHTGFKAGSSPMTMVDQAMADAIRSKGELDISEMQTITLKTEGFRDHDKKLFIVNPEADGFLSAIVNDPLFIEETNPYIEAAARKGEIQVKAKLARRAGQLERIYILDFERHA
jgi:hypothetical protein